MVSYGSFNSIEWIHEFPEFRCWVVFEDTFNSIEWIPTPTACFKDYLIIPLSIPLNGFSGARGRRIGGLESLSIPLNGFPPLEPEEARVDLVDFQFH